MFPELLSFMLLAPFLLRLAAGYFLFNEGLRLVYKDTSSKQEKTLIRLLGGTELILGALLFVGLFTQFAALIGMFTALLLITWRTKRPAYAPREKETYIFLCIVCISLLFLGAGAFGFDLPL